MIGWWLLGETFQRRSPWIIPNLLATTLYGERAYRPGFLVPTWAGLAGTVMIYCFAGILFAVVGRERKAGWFLLVVGIAAGLGLNWLCLGVVLKHLNPLIQLYSPDRLITVSHLLYGAALASYPIFAQKLQPTENLGAYTTQTRSIPPPIPEVTLETRTSDQDVGRGIP